MIGGDIVNPVGSDLAQLRDLEVVHADHLRVLPRTQLATGILEVANQLLLLGIHRDRRLAGGDRRLHRRIDVRELLIAVRMLAPLARLTVGLTAVLQIPRQVRYHPLTGLEALRGQRLDQVTQAAADPAQRRLGIAADGIVDQRLQRCRQARLMRHCALAPAARTTHTASYLVATPAQVLDAAIDRAARKPGRLRRRRNPAIALRQSLIGSEKPTTPLVEKAFCLLVAQTDVVDVDHTICYAASRRVAPRKFSILLLRS